MIEVCDPQPAIDTARQLARHWETLIEEIERLAGQHDTARNTNERLERETDELRYTNARLRAERETALDAANQLRSSYEALRAAHKGSTQELADLKVRYDSLLDAQQALAEGLETILSRLRG